MCIEYIQPKALFLLTLIAVTCLSAGLFAQPAAPSAAHMEAMKKLHFMVGKWAGESWRMSPQGTRETARVEEHIQAKLGGLVLLVEGVGKHTDPQTGEEKIVHNALGLLSYDPFGGGYKMQSHLSNGMSTTADAKFTDVGAFQWWFQTPGGTIRYTLQLNEANQWHEIGEFSPDGENWRQFFAMTLDRVSEK